MSIEDQVQPAGGAAVAPPGQQQGAPPPPGQAPPPAAGAAAGGDEPDSAPPEFDKNDMLHLPKREFLRKADKIARKTLRKAFGTADLKELSTLKSQWDEWRTQEEERKRAEMTEKEKLTADRDAEKLRADQAIRRMERAKNKVRVQRLERSMVPLAEQYIDPKMSDAAMAKFSRYLKENPKKARRIYKGGDASIGKWFQELATTNAKYAREGGPSVAPPGALARPPISNGLPPQRRERTPAPTDEQGLYKGKDPRPGRHNSMSDAEARDFARSKGLPWAT